MFCPHCGVQNQEADAKFCESCGKALQQDNIPQTVTNYNESSALRISLTDPEYEIWKIADNQKIANIIWMGIGIFQICFAVLMMIARMWPFAIFIIPGIWNISVACAKWKLPQKIFNKDADIPKHYEPLKVLIIFFVINVLLGGVIGGLLVLFDFYIRNLIFKNKKLFTTKVAGPDRNNGKYAW